MSSASSAVAGVTSSLATTLASSATPTLAVDQAATSARSAVSAVVPTLSAMLRARQLPESVGASSSSAWTDSYDSDSSYAGDG